MASSESIGELFVNITANTKEFNKAVDDTKKETDKFKSNVNNSTKAIKGLIAGVSFGLILKGIGDVAKASIDAASEAEEVNAKFNTAFKGIEEDAQAAAENLAENYGLARTESEKLLSGTGDLIKGFGASATEALNISTRVQELSVDLASYNNLQGGATQASEILTKAFLGERDALTSLGIKISEADVKQRLLEKGQEDLTGQALLLAKGQATLELATQQSGDAIGDFARTSESFANRNRVAQASVQDLRVELGRSLLPTASSVVGIFGELTGKVAEYIRKINDLRDAEKAQELGIATKEQELTILQDKLEENEKQIKIQKAINDADKIQYDFVLPAHKKELELLQRKNAQISRSIDDKNEEIKTTKEQKDEEIRLAGIEAANAKRREEQLRLAEELRRKQLEAIEDVIDENKSEIETIEDEIIAIQSLDAQDETTRARQLEALEILNAKKDELLEEEKTRIAEEKKAVEEAEAEKLRIKQEADEAIAGSARAREQAIRDQEEQTSIKRRESLENQITEYSTTADSILAIAKNVNDTVIQGLELQRDVRIKALEDQELSEEEFANKKRQIEKETAEQIYAIELAQFRAEKALALIQAGVNTALALTQPQVLANPFLFGAVGVAGAAQIAAIATQPDPPAPAFAQGGVVTAPTRAIVGDDRGEVMIGMGAQGAPLLNELANKIADGVKSNGGGKTVININSLYPPRQQDLDRLFRDGYPSLQKELQRRGVNT